MRIRTLFCARALSFSAAFALAAAAESAAQSRTLTLVGTDDPGNIPLGEIRFGNDVASAGDVNGDGMDDLVVGAPFEVTGGSWDGQAYLFYGGSSPNAVPDASLTGFPRDEEFGSTVSGAGDVNADGFDDFLVGAPMSDLPRENAGRVFLYLGKDGPIENADLILASGIQSDQFGMELDGGGDFNGDGFSDIVVSGRGWLTSPTSLVFFGSSTPDAIADLSIAVPSGGEFLTIGPGQWAGDVNGDGYDDLVAFGLEGVFPYPTSFVAVYLGGSAPDAEPDLFVRNPGPTEFLVRVSPAGDFDGDGFDDILVSTADEAENGFVRVEVYRGGESSLELLATFLTPAYPDEWGLSFGEELAAAGDMNEDGFDDVLIGVDIWTVCLYLGGESPAVIPARKYADPEARGGIASSSFGFEFGTAGDVDGDGALDVVVGAPTAEAPVPGPQSSRPGKAVVFFGETDLQVDRRRTTWVAGASAGALSVAPHPVRGGVPSRIAAPSNLDLRVDIVDVSGRIVASVGDGLDRRHGDTALSWDGRDSHGRMSAPGVYFLRAWSSPGGIRESRRIVLVR